MPYTTNDHEVQVRGTFDNGESWVNVWAFEMQDPGADKADLATALHAFYAEVYLLHISSHTKAVGATVKNLVTDVVTEATWATITGDDLADLLPTQCAVRLSLKALPNINGGPFLAGWSVNATDSDGLLNTSDQTGIQSALATLDDALIAADWRIGIKRPTVTDVALATQGRIGQRFDVIRKRANDLAEGYVTTVLGV